MGVRRIYVEKKKAYAVRAVELFENIKTYLGISDIAGVRVLVRYEIWTTRPFRRRAAPSFPSRRSMSSTRKHFRRKRATPSFPRSICRDSLTSARIPRCSACS